MKSIKSHGSVIEWVGYDGNYPCLCSGTIKIKIDGILHQFENPFASGGSYSWEPEGTTDGPWHDFIDYRVEGYPIVKKHIDAIRELMNENAEWGCCGGCI